MPGADLENKPRAETLLGHLKIIDELTVDVMAGLAEDDLREKTEFENPIANTKYESLGLASYHNLAVRLCQLFHKRTLSRRLGSKAPIVNFGLDC